MVDPRMRPRFELEVPSDVDRVIEQLRDHLEHPDCPHEAHFYPKHLEVRVAENERSFWSPELILSVESTEKGTALRGRFGPRQNLWTLFVAMYSALTFGTLVGLVLGLSQATLSQPAWGLWLVPICLVLTCGVYAAALFGRSLGGKQTAELRELVERAIGFENEPTFASSSDPLAVEAS